MARYVHNAEGIRKVANGRAVRKAVDARAEAIRGKAAGMYAADAYRIKKARPGKNRCHAIVYTADAHAINSNRLHGTLRKAKGAR